MHLLHAITAKLDRSGVADSNFPNQKGEYWAHCPFHSPDNNPTNFSVSVRGYCCLACGKQGGLKQLAEHMDLVVPGDVPGLTLQEYSNAKNLPVGFLKSLGVEEATETHNGNAISVLHITYRDENNKTLRVRRRLALKKGKNGDNRFLWAKGAGIYLYGLWRLADIRQAGWVLLVEGESDCHTAWLYNIPALGIPGANAWKSSWTSHLQDLDVYVWHEPDQGGDAFIATLQKDLPDAKVIIPQGGTKDLSEVHIKGGDVVALLDGLKKSAQSITSIKPLSQTANSLTDFASWVHSQLSERTARRRKIIIANALAEWLLSRRRLILDLNQDQTKGGRAYLAGDKNQLWPMDKMAVTTRCTLYEAGLNGTEAVYAFILEALVMETYRRGEKITLSRWQENHVDTLYISCGPSYIVRARAGQLDKVDNGTDNVWFAGDACYPEWEPTTTVEPLSLAAFNPSLETPAEVQSYTPEVQRSLLAVWLAALLSGVRPLPLLAMIGQKGGGKTTVAKAILRTLLGITANVSSLPTEVRDYWAQVTTSPLTGIDNADSDVPKWLLDEIANTVTGKNIETRELYTDGNKLTRPATAALIVTTRTATFCRADIAERTLPLLTAEFEDAARVADSDLLADVDTQRNSLMSWCALTAASLLADRRRAPRDLPLRFVDFARLVWAYMRQQGAPELAAPMLVSLRQAQALAIGEEDPLVEAIVNHFDDIVPLDDWQGNAADLIKALVNVEPELPHLGGSKTVTRRLREAKSTLAVMGFRLTELPRAGGNRHVTFHIVRAQSAQSAQTGKALGCKIPKVKMHQKGFQDCAYCALCAITDDYIGPAIWHNRDHDESVTITKLAGMMNGVRYFSVAESLAALPADQLSMQKNDHNPTIEDEQYYSDMADQLNLGGES